MNKLYGNIAKKKIKSESVNQITGEMHETLTTHTEYRYKRPNSGYKGVYMKRLADIVEVSKPAQRLFFAIVHNVDDYNKVITKWNKISDDNASNISKCKKELIDNNFLAKIHKSYVLNPFVALPRYQTNAPENQSAVQQIYNRYVENMNDWYEDIDRDAMDLYG